MKIAYQFLSKHKKNVEKNSPYFNNMSLISPKFPPKFHRNLENVTEIIFTENIFTENIFTEIFRTEIFRN